MSRRRVEPEIVERIRRAYADAPPWDRELVHEAGAEDRRTREARDTKVLPLRGRRRHGRSRC